MRRDDGGVAAEPPRQRAEGLARRIGDALLVDRPRLRSRLGRLARRGGRRPARESDWLAIEEEIERSLARVEARRARLPRPTFPEALPVSARRREIAAALAAHQVIVVAGETGSGKTTQLPKLCLELGRGVHGQIGHTQPRRLAARSVATRIAEELGTPLGDVVGYRVRFQERGHPDALLRLMTDGILLNELQRDRLLLRYDTLIIDEAHERSLNIDFLLGHLAKLLPRRPELKLIITSATIDTARFADHFAGAPVVSVAGRTWPVEVRYRPLATDDEEAQDRDQARAIVDAVAELAEARGDVLVFLPGEREIRDAAEALRKHHPAGIEVLPLYARLSAAEQARVFAPGARRRVVLATNVAETSLTVPGIRHVVDTGIARISRQHPTAQVQRLPLEPISIASADQRKGRCGRLGPGICLRLYAEEDLLARPAFTEPEILRTSLAAVILQMQANHLGRIESFPFIDPPDPRAVREGYRQLAALGALDARHRLTETGRRLARLPVDPRLGRMLLAAAELDSLAEVLVIVAALAVQDPRNRPHDARKAADAAHAEFADPSSDFLGLLNLWHAWREQRRQLSRNKLGKWCKTRFLGYMRMVEWQETVGQLDRLVRDMGLHPNPEPAPPERIHRALLAGLLARVARRDRERIYHGLRGRVLQLFPGSVLAERPPPWIVAAEFIETRRLYARTAATVRPAWIEAAAGDQARREHLDPRWSRRRGQVIAYERVTYHGLVLVARRRVNFGPFDPLSAREIFIRQALLDGEFDTRAPFLAHNRKQVAAIQELEAKHRRRDLLVGEEALHRFYDERLPAAVYDRRSFAAWWREVGRVDPERLHMPRSLLLATAPPEEESGSRYPVQLESGGVALPLAYRFAPDNAEDGVTATLPLTALERLAPEHFEWLVPGLLREKVEYLVRALPKSLRRLCVPVPETVTACLAELEPYRGSLAGQLRHALLRRRGVELPADCWDRIALPAHLTLHLRVVDAVGDTLATGDDLHALQRRLADTAHAALEAIASPYDTPQPLDGWSCAALPESVQTEQGGVPVTLWPALERRAEGVFTRLFDDPDAARQAHREGLRQLFLDRLSRERRALRRALRERWVLAARFAPAGDAEALFTDLAAASVERLCVHPPIRDREAFDARLATASARFETTALALADEIERGLEAYHRVVLLVAESDDEPFREEVEDQLAALVYPGFVTATPRRWLGRFPCYLAAIERRIAGRVRAPHRDRERAAQVAPWSRRLARWHATQRRTTDAEAATLFRWMVEEYRVSLFAQDLGTALPVSARRLERQWMLLERGA